MPYVPPPDIMATIDGRDRGHVVAALITTSLQLKAGYDGRKRYTEEGSQAHERADRLIKLAERIGV